MDLKALQLACRFSLPPNSLGYCGRDSAAGKFKTCVTDGVCKDVEKELEKFIVLNPYLITLSAVLKKPKFSYGVVEAYWLGNENLDQIQLGDYQLLLDNFLKQGVPSWLIEDLRARPPKTFIPHHLFQVLHVGVGRASGSVPFTLSTINDCMVRWGRVEKINDHHELLVDLVSLDKQAGSYLLTNQRVAAKSVSGFLPGLRVGQMIAVHWQQAVKILTLKEINQLAFWTQAVIDSVNQRQDEDSRSGKK
ncbi:hypothetical protein KJ605_02095 [Patescibacteria group bacterium]|nr:hypothetical protein [Patescibacteria group bacterium]